MVEDSKSLRQTPSLASEKFSKADRSVDRLTGGIFTSETVHQPVLRSKLPVESSPEYDTRKKQEPNIFFNSLTDREEPNRYIMQPQEDPWDVTNPKSEEKVFRLLYRKKFRLKA